MGYANTWGAIGNTSGCHGCKLRPPQALRPYEEELHIQWSKDLPLPSPFGNLLFGQRIVCNNAHVLSFRGISHMNLLFAFIHAYIYIDMLRGFNSKQTICHPFTSSVEAHFLLNPMTLWLDQIR